MTSKRKKTVTKVDNEAGDNIDDNDDFVRGFRDGWQAEPQDADEPYQCRSGFRAGAALRRISTGLMREGVAAEDEDKAAS